MDNYYEIFRLGVMLLIVFSVIIVQRYAFLSKITHVCIEKIRETWKRGNVESVWFGSECKI